MTRSSAVIAHIQGGLGNQLFCYATAHALAKRTGLPLRINTRTGFHREKYNRTCLIRQFCLQAAEARWWESYRGPLGRVRRSLQRDRDAKRSPQLRKLIQESKDQRFMPELVELRPCRTVYLIGYWQNEDYFIDAADTLRETLQLRDDTPFAPNAEIDALTAQPNAVSVHFRSYKEVPGGPSTLALDQSYYQHAMQAAAERVPDAQFVVFSDDVGAARSVIDSPQHRSHTTYATAADADPTTMMFTDFRLMSRCRHHIVANSSFSWWTAWLGEHEESLITAPHGGLPGNGRFPDRWLFWADASKA